MFLEFRRFQRPSRRIRFSVGTIGKYVCSAKVCTTMFDNPTGYSGPEVSMQEGELPWEFDHPRVVCSLAW
jgi:hypothetical protein